MVTFGSVRFVRSLIDSNSISPASLFQLVQNLVTTGRIFEGPTSVIICGSDRPLLNWVAYALAVASDAEFHWTDVRLEGEVLAPEDLLSRNVIPTEQLSTVRPPDLAPDDTTANVAVSAVIRSDEPPDEVRRLVEFLRLPAQTQSVLSRVAGGESPRVVVLSNGHRLVAIYPNIEVVRPTLRAIVASGVVLIMTFADAAPQGRFAFDTVIHVDSSARQDWRRATARVEKGASTGFLRAGAEYRLGEASPWREVLSKHLG